MRMRAAIFSLVLLACGHSTKPGEAGSCRDGDNSCIDYTAAQAAAGKRMCPPARWTAGEKSCPTENRLGACTSKDGAAKWMYGGPPNNFSVASAKSSCEFSGGVFSATP